MLRKNIFESDNPAKLIFNQSILLPFLNFPPWTSPSLTISKTSKSQLETGSPSKSPEVLRKLLNTSWLLPQNCRSASTESWRIPPHLVLRPSQEPEQESAHYTLAWSGSWLLWNIMEHVLNTAKMCFLLFCWLFMIHIQLWKWLGFCMGHKRRQSWIAVVYPPHSKLWPR